MERDPRWENVYAHVGWYLMPEFQDEDGKIYPERWQREVLIEVVIDGETVGSKVFIDPNHYDQNPHALRLALFYMVNQIDKSLDEKGYTWERLS